MGANKESIGVDTRRQEDKKMIELEGGKNEGREEWKEGRMEGKKWKDGRRGRMEGKKWKDGRKGRMEDWKIGRMEGWEGWRIQFTHYALRFTFHASLVTYHASRFTSKELFYGNKHKPVFTSPPFGAN
jgi:hypothetical protein